MADLEFTVREQIVQDVLGDLAKMQWEGNDFVPAGDMWQKVKRGDIDNYETDEFPMVCVTDEDEEVADDMNTHMLVTMSLIVEFGWRGGKRIVDRYEEFNYYLGKLKTLFLGNSPPSPDYAIDFREVAAKPEIAGDNDETPIGYLELEVLFRHQRADPNKV